MLLARQGFKVLLVDRATLPSDILSTHILWPHGAEILARWGLPGTLAATGAPPICRRMTFDVGPFGAVARKRWYGMAAARCGVPQMNQM